MAWTIFLKDNLDLWKTNILKMYCWAFFKVFSRAKYKYIYWWWHHEGFDFDKILCLTSYARQALGKYHWICLKAFWRVVHSMFNYKLKGNTNVHSVRSDLNHFSIPLPRTEAFRRQYTFGAPKLLNERPLHVTSSETLPIFLKR